MMSDWLVPDWPAPKNVRALLTTRAGGVSSGAFATLNLASHVADDPASVAENRRRLRAHLPSEPLWLAQVHGSRVVCAEESVAGVEADGAFSRRPGVVCAVLTADCLPVLLCDAAGSVVAVAHAGWRGLAAGVIEATAAAMGPPPSRLLAYLGPAIGPQVFEVGGEVREEFLAHSAQTGQAFVAARDGKWLCDLYMLARQRLAALGVTRVFGGGWCTVGDTERFYSYRRQRVTGRMAALIWLQP
jgi:YfiH family protein